MDCRQFQNRLVDLQELAPGEQTDLERHAETCPACRVKLDEYRGLMAALRDVDATLHPDGGRLTRFAIHRAAPSEPDYDQARLSSGEIRQIEGHVGECPRCRLAVETIVERYEELDGFLAATGVPPLTIDREPMWRASIRDAIDKVASWTKNVFILPPSYSTTGVAFGALLAIGILWMGPWLRGPYENLALVETTEISFLTRNAGADTDTPGALADGISLLNEGRYSEAIPLLERVTRGETEPSSGSDRRLESYAHYLSGLASVHEAKTELFGRVLAYDETHVNRAIEHLQAATESGPPSSGRVLEDAYWLLGKAYLMQEKPAPAIAAFTEVERMEGRRAHEARQLIESIEEIERP